MDHSSAQVTGTTHLKIFVKGDHDAPSRDTCVLPLYKVLELYCGNVILPCLGKALCCFRIRQKREH